MWLTTAMGLKQACLVVLVSVLVYKFSDYFIGAKFDGSSLPGKNIIITGASSGIGEQIAYEYVRYGANIFITARREQRLKEVIKKCKALGKSHQKYGFLTADMSKVEDRIRLIKSGIEFLGGIDHLVLNHAQMPKPAKWKGSDEQLEEFNSIMNVNVASYVHLTAAAMPALKRTSGSICVIGSGSGRLPTPFTLPYVSSKFALDGFFSSLRYEFKATKENISVTHCILGLISTEAGLRTFSDIKELMSNKLIINLIYQALPEDAAKAIVSATAQRKGELYFPSYQMIWFFSVIKSIIPELEKFLL